MPGQHPGQHLLRPGLQGLGHQGMDGIAKGAHGEVPGLFPAQPFHVHQKPHQFRDGNGRMGVVELDRDLVAEPFKGGILILVAPEDILKGG